MNNRTIKTTLITFGLGGHGIDYHEPGSRHSGHLSGYESPENFVKRVAAGDYTEYDLNGVPVVDKRYAVARKPALAITLPMHNGALEPNEIDKLDRGDGSFIETLGGMNQGNMWGTLCNLSKAPQFSGLDQVGTAVYLSLWQQNGARLGVFRNGAIEWSDGGEFELESLTEKQRKEISSVLIKGYQDAVLIQHFAKLGLTAAQTAAVLKFRDQFTKEIQTELFEDIFALERPHADS
jgi:hypothetical protein